MKLEKQKFPWLDAMEFELNHRVTHYLMTEHEDYSNQHRQIKELMNQLWLEEQAAEHYKEQGLEPFG